MKRAKRSAHTGGRRFIISSAVDTQRRMYDALGIQSIPHVILVDPWGIVRWEGFPLQEGHELTEEVLDNLLDTYVAK